MVILLKALTSIVGNMPKIEKALHNYRVLGLWKDPNLINLYEQQIELIKVSSIIDLWSISPLDVILLE